MNNPNLRPTLSQRLRLKSLINSILYRLRLLQASVSCDYSFIDPGKKDEVRSLTSSWKNRCLPIAQRKIVDLQLQKFALGCPVDVFDVFIRSLRLLEDLDEHSTLLDVGCSSGYYSEVCAIAKFPIKYFGCDYSESFIQMAKSLYPSIDFKVSDATLLDYQDSSFDVVVSGCCLLHIPNYILAIRESARVSSKYIIFHRTPVVWGIDDQWFKKKAYGVDTIEIHFNENNLLSLFNAEGISVISAFTLSQDISDDHQSGKAEKTYVCKLN